MADASVVVDNVLCFVIARFGKTAIKQLKSAVIDFYSVEDLCAAKDKLLRATELWNSELKLPHIPLRRDGDRRAAKTVDDIVAILTCLDENLKLKCLPRYVADSPDAMPSIRLYDGDLQSLMAVIDKLKDRLDHSEAALAAILKVVNTTADMVSTRSVQSAVQWPPLPSHSQAAVNNSQQVGGLRSTAGSATAGAASADFSADVNAQSTSVGARPSWAMLSSTPTTSSNRFAALASTSDDDQTDVNAELPFNSVQSRRTKRARQRSSPQPVNNVPHQQQQQQQQQQLRSSSRPTGTRPGRGLLMGKSGSSVPGQRIVAANKILKKAVFCVDNVHSSVNTDDLTRFVATLSVRVVSCFPTKPRRRRDEAEPVNRNAFRLCIPAEDRARLLDDTKWPESIVISEWYFINPADRRRTGDEQSTQQEGAASASSSGGRVDDYRTSVAEDTVIIMDTAMSTDDTILANDTVQQ